MAGKIVLVVDDNEDALDMARTVLEEQGFQVITSTDGKNCMRDIVVRKPDLIVLDINMPNMGGLSTLDMIKVVRIGRAVPIVVWSGEADEELRVKCENLGADDFVSKSTAMPEFVRRIQAHLFMVEPRSLPQLLGALPAPPAGMTAPMGIAPEHAAWQPHPMTHQDLELCVMLGPGVTREAAAQLPLADLQKKVAVYHKVGGAWRRSWPLGR